MKSKLYTRLYLGLSAITLALSAPSAYSETVTFNTAGTTNWVCPDGVTVIQVECWGGGGAGGAATKVTNTGGNTSQNGGGGGGGAYATKFSVPVTPGASYTITIPPAAVSVAATTTTQVFSNGSPVTFVGDLSVTVTAAGGAGGGSIWRNTNVTAGGSGGAGGSSAGSVGDAIFSGGNGSGGNTGATNVSGSGGGGGGNSNPGGAGFTSTANPYVGAGPGGLVGGGDGGVGRTGTPPTSGNTNKGVGTPGMTPGGGGGGAKNQAITSFLGGEGGLGQITITYADSIVKANNTDDLNLTTSWVEGVVPDTDEMAVWNDTVTSANTTSLAADTTWGGIQIAEPGGAVTINAGNILTLGLAPIDIDMSAATQDLTLNCELAMNAANVWNVNADRTLVLSNVVSGSPSVVKSGAGTVVLSGANTYTGSTNVNGGTLNITGSITGLPASSKININPTSGNAIVNYSGGSSTLFAVTGATVAGTASVFNMTDGTLTISPAITTGTQSVVGAGNAPAAGAGAYGYYNITGGTFRDLNRFTLTGQATASATNGTGVGVQTAVVFVGGSGVIDQTGGEWMLNYSLGQITVADSGKIDRTDTTSPFGLIMNHATGVTGGGYGVLNVAGTNAQVILGAQPIRFGNSATAGQGEGQSGFVNVASGILSVGANASTNLPAAPATINNAYFNFAGGTVKATGNLTGWIPVSNASINFNSTIYGAIDNVGTSSDFTGGVTFDTNGFDMTVANPLTFAAGAGVTQADLSISGGSGYVGAPAVIFSSVDVIAGGSPAAGYAVISGGAVTEIVITSPGTYTAGTTPTITLIGGGGTGASVLSGALNTSNGSGGLIKSGAGALTLAGANTYTGATTVNLGTLKSSTAGSATTDISVASGASAGALVAAADGQWINAGDLTFANNSTLLIDYGSVAPSISVAPISVENLSVGTNLTLKIEGSTVTSFTAGQSYPLVTWTTSGPPDGAAFTSILPPRLVGNFSVVGNTLYLDVTSNPAGQAISWSADDGSWDTVATNWIDANAASTAFIDIYDIVLFGDAGSPTGNRAITLNSAFSPVSVTMNSVNHDYTITGSGGIGGTGALTLDASNTKTLTLGTVNTYTGGTVINGGTLKISGSGTLGAAGSLVSVSSGALLDLNGTNQSITFAAGTGVGTVANNSGSGTSVLTLTGTPTINGSHVTIVDNTNASSGKVAVVITGNTQPMSNANTYSGGTTVNGGAFLYLNASATMGAGTGTINLVAPGTGATGNTGSGLVVDGASYANDITGAGYIHANSSTANNVTFTGNLTNTGPYIWRGGAVAGNTFNFAGDGTTSVLSGVIGSTTSQVNGAVATGNVIKSGTGTLTLSGENVYSGTTTVSAGILNLTGNRTATAGGITVGNLVGSTGTLNVSNGTFQTGQFAVGSGDGTAIGIVNQTGGTLTLTGNQLLLGNGGVTGALPGAGGNGTYNLSAGTLTATSVTSRGVMLGTNDGGTSTFNLSGTGNLLLNGALSQLMVGRADSPVVNTTNVFNQTGGSATVSILSIGGAAAGATGLNSTFSVTGGTFTAGSFPSLGVGASGIVTMNIGGTADITLPSFPTVRGSSTTVTLNFDGGTLKPLAASATYISNLTNAFIKSGGAKIDTTNGSITIPQSLLTDLVSLNGGLTKEGINTLTLGGANTFTGNTIVNAGTLDLADNAQLKFVLGATSGVNNSISGAGTAVLNGDFVIDTAAADALASGSWTLENVTSLSGEYGASFTVVGFVDAGSNKWTKDIGGGKTYTFDETTGILTLAPGGYAAWAAVNAIGSAANLDKDGDGVNNAIEYVLGGDVNTNDISKLPQSSISGMNLIFTFLRDVETIDGSTAVTIEVGTTLSAWPTVYTVGADTAGSTAGVVVTEDSSPGFDTITLTVPMGTDPKKFARLNVEVP